MILFLRAQDIWEIEIALIDVDEVSIAGVFEARPDDFVHTLSRFISDSNVLFSAIDAVLVVEGPGSQTACHSALSLANVIGFSQNIPVWQVGF